MVGDVRGPSSKKLFYLNDSSSDDDVPMARIRKLESNFK